MTSASLKVKTGVVKRLHKEYIYYQKEEQSQRNRIEKLKAAKADEHDVKKQYEVLEETLKMIPDCKQRLLSARSELEQLLVCYWTIAITYYYDIMN